MASTFPNLLKFLRVVVGACRDDPRDDATLLARFVETGNDEAAFQVLVWRHAPLVWHTCRRILGDTPDAEDAFQTTFLTLARKAGRLRKEPLAGWLHRVARQAALNAVAGVRRRRGLEQRVRAVRQPEAEGENAERSELYAALDEELAGLPEQLRVPLLLRYFEGKSQDDVAHILGCSRFVVRTRLARAEAMLRQRLERRGLEVGVVSIGILLGGAGVASDLPAYLIGNTVRAALRSLAFPPTSSTSATLAAGMKNITLTKVKLVAVLLGMTLCLAGGGLLAYHALAGNAAETSQPTGEPGGKTEASPQPEAATRVDCYGDPLPTHALARMGTTRLWVGGDGDFLLAFSPDGKMLAASRDGMTVCLWDAATGKEISRLTTKAVQRGIKSLAFSPDGKALVTVDYDQMVCRWDIATGKLFRKQQYQGLKRDDLCSLQVVFLLGGKILGSGDFRKSPQEGRAISVWDVATGKEICQLSEKKRRERAIDVNVIAFSTDGKLLATVMNREKIIHLWEVATGKEIRQLRHEDGRIGAVAFSPDKKTLSSADNGKICVWEVATGKKIHQFQPKKGMCDSPLIYSPDEKTLLGGRAAGHLWDVVTGKEIRSFGWEHARVAVFSPNGKILAVGDEAGSIRLWEVATGKEIDSRKEYRGHIRSVAYSPDGKTLASMGEDETTVLLWEAVSGKEMHPLAKHTNWGDGSIAYSPDGKMFLSMEANVLHLWDTTTGKEIRRFGRRRGGVILGWRAIFSPDGKKLAAGWEQHWHSSVCAWEVATGKLIYALETQQDGLSARRVATTAFSPDGRLLATPGKDNMVCLWQADTGRLIGQLGRPKKWTPGGDSPFVFSLAFSPDSWMLATSSVRDEKVRLWEVATGKEIGQLDSLKKGFRNGCLLAFSPDGRMLATAAQARNVVNGSIDPTVHLWEVASGKEIGRLAGHQAPIQTIAFSPDGKTLASGSDDLTCLIWDVTFMGRMKPVPARSVALEPLSREQLEAAWTGLADRDPVNAYRALGMLTLSPTQAIALLQARLRPIALLTNPQQLKRWIVELDDSSFTVRDKAQREIEKLGEAALPALRQALQGRPSLETKRRLQDLLTEWELKGEVVVSPERMRELRAVHVLESIGTAEAQQVLQAWAKGFPEARLTREAEAALAHLAKRSAAKP